VMEKTTISWLDVLMQKILQLIYVGLEYNGEEEAPLLLPNGALDEIR
jgi:hypothetical protein